MRRVTLITTGGTIEKIYDEVEGRLSNRRSIVRRMLSELRLEDRDVSIHELMHKDSLELSDRERQRIVDAALLAGADDPNNSEQTGIVILHGTDTLSTTGDLLFERIPEPQVPVVLTGALRPYEMKRSDALQNLTEALFATAVLPPGIYCVAHGKALPFPGVVKDRSRGTFVKA